MPILYCPSCSAKNEYTLTKPKICSKCGKPMSVSIVLPAAFSKDVAKAQAYKHMKRARDYDAEASSIDSDVENDNLDEDLKDVIKDQIIASLNGSISISVEGSNDDKIKFGDLQRS